MKTCVIYVNYFCSHAIHQSILSIADLSKVDIYVADNSGDYKTIAVEKDVRKYENIGYLPAFLDLANRIIEHKKYQYLILSNPDINFSHDFFEFLTETPLDENTSIIGPKIIEDGHGRGIFIQRKPTLLWFLKQLIIHSSKFTYDFARFFKRQSRTLKSVDQVVSVQEVFAVHGSLMIFTSLGTTELPDGYFGFLYSEELFLGLHFMNKGRKTIYDPTLKVYHSAKATTGELGAERQRRYIFINTLKMFKSYLLLRFERV